MKSLTSKVFLILTLVFVLYAAGEYAVQRFLIFPSFIALEQDEAKKDLARCVQAISREAYHLDALCHDWAAWDDPYEFILAPSEHEAFVEANLIPATFTGSEINLIYFLDTQNRVVWGKIYDLETEEIIAIPDFPGDALPTPHPLTSWKIDPASPSKAAVSGVFMTGRGPMLVSARPILNSEYEGPSRGTLILGRLLSEKLLGTLVDQTSVDFEIFAIQAATMPEPLKGITAQITGKSPFLMKESDKSNLLGYTTVPDVQGAAALLLKAKVPRKISERGVVTTRAALISILLMGTGFLSVILLLLRQIVLKPIANLTAHTLSIAESGDLSKRSVVVRSDEIGVLSKEFDEMMERLADARKKMMEQSYHSGMAEMASGILHNVRNSLSPVLAQLDLLRITLQKVPLEQMEMAQKELDGDSTSGNRRQDLLKFVQLSNRSLVAITTDTRTTLDEVSERIGHIEQILDDHQQWGGEKRLEEVIPLKALLQEAVHLLKGEPGGSLSTHLDPGLAGVGAVRVHRLSFLQVIENLWMNAAEAIERKGEARGKIHIQAACQTSNGQEFIHLMLRDNGSGITQENLNRIFERGFSTKTEKASGIGLHWCANTISAMRGRIYAESEGPEKGACLNLILPAHSTGNS